MARTRADLADIVFYCDDDARWVHPTREEWPSNAWAWYDRKNDMILDMRLRDGRQYPPGCRSGDGTLAEEYNGAISRDGRYRDKKTITICNRAFTGSKGIYKYMGFLHIRPGKDLSRLKRGRRPTLEDYYLVSTVVVHEVSSIALVIEPRHIQRTPGSGS